jgi:hypothetical protein
MRPQTAHEWTLPKRPVEVAAASLFFVFGASMSGLAAAMLLFPGGVLEPIWRINPRAHDAFIRMGAWALALMALVCVGCATAALGLWRCTRWGLWTALAILIINLAGDTTNALVTRDWRTLIGLPIGGLMIAFLLRQRHVFDR